MVLIYCRCVVKLVAVPCACGAHKFPACTLRVVCITTATAAASSSMLPALDLVVGTGEQLDEQEVRRAAAAVGVLHHWLPGCMVRISACESRVIIGLLDWTVSTKPLNTSSPTYRNCSYLCFSPILHGSHAYPYRIHIQYDRGDLTYPCN